MCTAFTEQLEDVTNIRLNFNTSPLTSSQVCSCTIATMDACNVDEIWTNNECVDIGDVVGFQSFVDNQVLSRDRGCLAATWRSSGGSPPRWWGYDTVRNSSGRYGATTQFRFRVGQFSAFGSAHLEGQVQMKSE